MMKGAFKGDMMSAFKGDLMKGKPGGPPGFGMKGGGKPMMGQMMGGQPMGGQTMGGKPAGKGFELEDRSWDWHCPTCRERNFVKRAECFKCRTPKPKDGDLTVPKRPQPPANGTTLNGMVKSYNRKGFGFLMCLGTDYGQDIYYTRENLSPRLQTHGIPGQHITFEIQRFHDGKLTALNIRPLGEDKEDGMRLPTSKGGGGGGQGKGSSAAGSKDDEDRSRDWVCTACSERNFVKRFECFKCKKPRAQGFTDAPESSSRSRAASPPPPPKRTLSPHAGSRAVRDMLAGRAAKRSASHSRSRGRGRSRSKKRASGRSRSKKRKRSKSQSDSSDSSHSRERRKKDKKSKRKKSKSRSSSSGSDGDSRSDSESSDCKMEPPSGSSGADADKPKGGGSGDPQVDAAKSEALQELLKLRSVEPKEARMSEWRALLRKWHPDKNPDRVEVATAVFQFLQKGKAILNEEK